MKRIDSLDSLRGLAILMVTAIHCSQAYTSTSGISNLLFPFGSLGVQLFFMVSGFTMLLTFGVQFNRQLVTWAWMSTMGHLPSFELGFIAVALISYGLSRYFIAPWIENPAIAFGKKLAHSK